MSSIGLLALFITIAFVGILLHVNRMVFGRPKDHSPRREGRLADKLRAGAGAGRRAGPGAGGVSAGADTSADARGGCRFGEVRK